MKPRAPRRRVLVCARLRAAAGWVTVQILDLSTRGLKIRSPEPPPTGSFVEVRRGPHVIIGRVVWTDGERAGVATQDSLEVNAIAGDPAGQPAECSALAGVAPTAERRREPRGQQSEQRLEASRLVARAMHFVCLAALGAAASLAALGAVDQALSAPMSRAAAALDQR